MADRQETKEEERFGLSARARAALTEALSTYGASAVEAVALREAPTRRVLLSHAAREEVMRAMRDYDRVSIQMAAEHTPDRLPGTPALSERTAAELREARVACPWISFSAIIDSSEPCPVPIFEPEVHAEIRRAMHQMPWLSVVELATVQHGPTSPGSDS